MEVVAHGDGAVQTAPRQLGSSAARILAVYEILS